MFASASAFARPQQFAHAYHRVGAETAISTASPHQLVALLYQGFQDAIAQARGAMRAGEIERKNRAIKHALSIVDEGLRACLDLESGGQLAKDLHALYGYIELRLTHANLRNDEAVLDECQRLMQPLQDAWNAIGDKVGGQPGRG
ncbi:MULTISPECIES: flagellar export chaperone FliS [Rubrivivax]|uniref:Flagellar secretion chaperone FliS n=1 Tax=Rubrivivax benzoatilyticus TaxID=316997 RepID=A0ABX0HY42_9BURK|nr:MULTISPECIES: flagellar export chaperone FliS [Rubrivivax]MCD0418435.1 flagellar export chaperone FliS [Rubrivivax sp. JA1024]EGJ11380.1 flagellar protein FliS [Rubrivivax benzoatilyticus JA2 = ATCC BAA-35]MCC9596185.1 flagellar export chaperone FliS [Rubrivivax sp. JA1055]MCC9647474.1 flagellar export chaperone FliS [Rubrivivax sp. JA1029]NHK99914.1 flagellar export chaperone FliS [Rubrivivax benzoatilyticus]